MPFLLNMKDSLDTFYLVIRFSLQLNTSNLHAVVKIEFKKRNLQYF